MDDLRDFKDERPALVARSSPEALKLLDELEGERIDHLWLDYDLVGNDTIRPVVDLLVHRPKRGSPLNAGQIHIWRSPCRDIDQLDQSAVGFSTKTGIERSVFAW